MEKMDATYALMLSLFAEMVWDDAIKKYKEQRLYQEIDYALARKDEASFKALTNELKLLG